MIYTLALPHLWDDVRFLISTTKLIPILKEIALVLSLEILF